MARKTDQTLYRLLTKADARLTLPPDSHSTAAGKPMPVSDAIKHSTPNDQSTNIVSPSLQKTIDTPSTHKNNTSLDNYPRADINKQVSNFKNEMVNDYTLDNFHKLKEKVEAIIEEKQKIEREVYQLHMENIRLQNINEERNARYQIDIMIKEAEDTKQQIIELKNEKVGITKQIEQEAAKLKEEEMLFSKLLVQTSLDQLRGK